MTTFPSVSGERDYLDGYSVGFYLAEGNEMVGRRGIQLSCGVKDKIFLEKISKRFSLKIYNYGRNLAIRSYDEKYINLIRQSVKGRTSHDKHLSNRAYSFGTAFLRGVLDGFLDGDGYYDKKNNRWRIRITINEDLITDLILLSRIAGYDIRVEGKDSKTNSVGLSIRKHWKNRHIFRNLYFQQILNIEKIEDGELYDVEVEPIYGTYRGKGKPQGRTRQKRLDKWNNLFALGNGILTHNCWYKPNHMPSSVKDRLTNTWEHLFHFVKNRRYYYDLDAIRKPHKESTKKRLKQNISSQYKQSKANEYFQNLPLNRSGIRKEIPQILQQMKENLNPLGKNPGDVVKHDLAVGRIGNYSYTDPLHTKEYNPLGKNPGDVIKVKSGKYKNANIHSPGERDWVWVEKRLNLPKPEELITYLKEWKQKAGLSYREIDKLLGYDGDTCSHWFTHPQSEHGFAYPSKEDWKKLKKILKFDDRYDKAMTETVLVPSTDLGHPLGKNPGDVIKVKERIGDAHKGEATANLYLPHITHHPLGQNPGDVISIFQAPYFRLAKHYDRKNVKFSTDETKWYVPDFWSITTQPFKEAHFAVFPERLVVDPIKSSCPKWICNKCGKPRKRITKISGKYSLNWGIQYKYRDKIGEKVYSNIRETVGWSDCGCGEGFHPGVVLDPFCGSGTVLVVAHKLGRYWIGIDQKPEYCEMARRRLEKVGAFSRRLEEYTC